METLAMQKGMLPGGLSFARLGNGPHTVVIFPGLADAACDVASRNWDFPLRDRQLADVFTLYIIGRKRGLAQGYTTRDMAADYARAFESEIGSADVVGISLGGYVAQHFAADYPQHVKHLVIACAAHRVSEKGRKAPERWLGLARRKRWWRLYWDIARVTMEEYRQSFKRFLIPLLQRASYDPADFLVSLEACLAHDGWETLARIQAPTLVIGGTKDIFFPPSLLRETASRIPEANLRFIVGGGHSAYELYREEFEDAVVDFLDGRKGLSPAEECQPVLATDDHEVQVTA